MGRMVSMHLHLPRTSPITLTALYAPAGDSPQEQSQRGELHAALGKLMHNTHIIAGDMNAALRPGDRPNTDTAPGWCVAGAGACSPSSPWPCSPVL